MKFFQICKAVFSHDTTHYFAAMGAEEVRFWETLCQNSIWKAAWQYNPRHKGVYWVTKIIFVRMVLPYLIFFSGALSVLTLLLYLAFSR